ncbi:hypothetical protein LINPERHAP2_LOCUS3692 [Linum perenne]
MILTGCSGWRTMLVVPELEREVELLWQLRDTRKHLRLLRNERDRIEDEVHHLKWSLKFENLNADRKKKLICALDQLEAEMDKVRITHQQAQRECHQKFHKVWGQLMKTGYQNSRFAHQCEVTRSCDLKLNAKVLEQKRGVTK